MLATAALDGSVTLLESILTRPEEMISMAANEDAPKRESVIGLTGMT